ncbi:MAG TPA: glycosyltransferase family 2 protein [Candidatus Rubrimentiphilum sp.]|nr:glycosyltransferase family 2 protein [Candidatus Rubrimentiphilum sp.]
MIERFKTSSELSVDSDQLEQRLYCVIPAYRAAGTILEVVSAALKQADVVIVVDDGCPERSGHVVQQAYNGDDRVQVIIRERNGGVGAATKTGIGAALDQGADVIVKLDADGQMDPAFIATIRELFVQDPSLVCIKGNRFFDSSVMNIMPKTRLIGNAILSLLVKCASGYWNAIDPTNGYLAFNGTLLRVLPWRSFADSYFFEMSVLCELGLRRLPILELEMPTIYTSAPSSLAILPVIFEFPPQLFRLALRRLLVQYFVFDVNLASLYCFFGTLLATFGIVFGVYEWVLGTVTHVPRATGTIMLAAVTFLVGFQLLLNALMYDVQFSQRTYHELKVRPHERPARGDRRARPSR